ncbi:MAG: hypothetical protein M0Z99_00825 [Betaproteobacteria bacterium]|nr:hypothetical protein [Betaproteobacteria bacterium]
MARSGDDKALWGLLGLLPWWGWVGGAAVVWLYSVGGWLLLGGLVVVGVLGLAVQSMLAAQHQDAQELIRRMAREQLQPNEARRLNMRLMRSDSRLAEVVRSVQIMRNSVDIAAKSKKREIVESRLGSVLSLRGDIRRNYQGVCDEETDKVLDWLADDEVRSAWTAYFLNAARQARDKAMTLKTEKSRTKYEEAARSFLDEAMAHPMTKKAQIEALLKNIA